jgi:hypothetical protein
MTVSDAIERLIELEMGGFGKATLQMYDPKTGLYSEVESVDRDEDGITFVSQERWTSIPTGLP